MTFAHALAIALSAEYLRRALLVMLIVGSILNLINQGDALLRGHGFDVPKLLLTYVVPFCVATYGAASALASRKPTPLESL
jgi:hypothetical protein